MVRICRIFSKLCWFLRCSEKRSRQDGTVTLVRVDVHNSVTGERFDGNFSSTECSNSGPGTAVAENEYEDIYLVTTKEKASCSAQENSQPQHHCASTAAHHYQSRRGSKDSGSHSRSESVSSTNSNNIKHSNDVTHDDIIGAVSEESGVSSASPSDLGHSEEETELSKTKSHHHTLPHHHQSHKVLKRVVSEPIYTPPPAPPLPPFNLGANWNDSSTNNKTNIEIGSARITSVAYKNHSADDRSVKTEVEQSVPTYQSSNCADSQNTSSAASSLSTDELNTASTHTSASDSSPSTDGSERSASNSNETSSVHLANKPNFVLPFVPPKFTSADNGSNSLIKPSEYLRSIAAANGRSKFVRSRSVPEDDTQRSTAASCSVSVSVRAASITSSIFSLNTGSPALPNIREVPETNSEETVLQSSSTKVNRGSQQPVSFVSAQELSKVQLRPTGEKITATKTMSAPQSTVGVSHPIQSQRENLIAELKMSKDIIGIKKLKVERVKLEEKQEKQIVTEITKQFSVESFVDKIPATDATGNPIPPWKRQMMAKKAAEKAKKELEEQLAKEAEERRLQAIPAWKRQLLQTKKTDERCTVVKASKEVLVADKESGSSANAAPEVKVTVMHCRQQTRVVSTETEEKRIVFATEEEMDKENNKPAQTSSVVLDNEGPTNVDDERTEDKDEEDNRIIPWRAQLRKTNSKLSLID